MTLSQKCQYAIRATYELGKRYGQGPVRLHDIADAQAIPARFLELILRQLRQGGFVESRRGVNGGYLLAMPPDELSVGQIINFIDGEPNPVQCVAASGKSPCPLHGKCAFIGLWTRARDAVNQIYGETSLQNLIDEQEQIDRQQACDYSI